MDDRLMTSVLRGCSGERKREKKIVELLRVYHRFLIRQ